MIIFIVLTMLVSGLLSDADIWDDMFQPDRIVERDGYVVERNTHRSERSAQPQHRYARAASDRTDFSQQEITELVEYHNSLRSRVYPPASNMEYMEWDDTLAYMAQQWAENCAFQHGQVQDLSPYDFVGQNIFVGSGDNRFRSGVFATQKWSEEEQWYNYDSDRCAPGEMCGHYTQVVWASTNRIGCGRRQCRRIVGYGEPNAYLIVCNYGPTGNFIGYKPYDSGNACSKCPGNKPRCYQGLCHNCSAGGSDCECRLRCENCGTFIEDQCTCNCMNGWTGTDCSTICEDVHEWCGANPGWPTSDSCYMFSYVPSKCPKLCGLCNAADKHSKCDSKKPEAGLSTGKRILSEQKKPLKQKKKSKSFKPAYCTENPFAVAVIDNELVMFRKGKMWRFSASGQPLSDANGEYVQRKYSGVVNGFKAVYQRQYDNRIIFIRGADFYVFNGNTLESGPTKLKSVGLKPNPSAAFYHQDERKSYFFKGPKVWRFDDRRQKVDRGFPKQISEVFEGVPAKITGAFQNANGDLNFVQGKGYYEVPRRSARVSGGRKLFHRELLNGC